MFQQSSPPSSPKRSCLRHSPAPVVRRVSWPDTMGLSLVSQMPFCSSDEAFRCSTSPTLPTFGGLCVGKKEKKKIKRKNDWHEK